MLFQIFHKFSLVKLSKWLFAQILTPYVFATGFGAINSKRGCFKSREAVQFPWNSFSKMLNFSRFKYRRKGCLEFYSPTRNKSENQLVPDSRQDQGRKERLEVQNGRNDFTSSSDATCWPRNNATTQPSPYEKELQSQNKSESCIIHIVNAWALKRKQKVLRGMMKRL